MSYWTKRRRIQLKFEQHIDNLSQNTNLNNQIEHVSTTCSLKASAVDPMALRVRDTNLEPLIANSNSDYDVVNSSVPSDNSQINYDISSTLARWSVENNITHSALGKLLCILQPSHPYLPKDPRTLLSTGKTHGIKTIGGGSYYHFGVYTGIVNQLSSDPTMLRYDTISIQISTDGLPLFKSSNLQLWPILASLLRTENRSDPFVIGLFLGPVKPQNAEEFLSDFVDEMTQLQTNGLSYGDKTYNVRISSFVCDAPARAFVKNIKSHSGYSACEKCTQRGVYNNKMTFPETDAALRTDVAFDEMADEAHHTGPNPLQRLGIPMVSSFPIDYMHLVCLGVTRRLITMWTKGPLTVRLGPQVKREISSCMISLSKFIPKDFSRKPRSLVELDRWKATEFRQFLLYTGMISLKGKLPDGMYNNFLILSVGISILANPSICHLYCDYAEKLLVCFVKQFAQIYGQDQIVYNVHNLVHLAKDVQKHGPLDAFSAFPFENRLKKIKSLVRKQSFALQQIVLRVSEEMQLPVKSDKDLDETQILLKKKHYKGPLPSGQKYATFEQYKQVTYKNLSLTTKPGNNCVSIGSDICLIENILQCSTNESEVYIVYQKFRELSDFFTYPLKSTQIDIQSVSRLSQTIEVDSIKSINRKYVLLPCEERHVAIPLIHT